MRNTLSAIFCLLTLFLFSASALSKTVNVLDFGAKGDGATDDALAFLLAIVAGDKIIVPSTETGYLINNSIVVNKPVKIVGDHKVFIQADRTLFYITSSDVEISGFEIDMNSSGPGTAAFYLDSSVSKLDRIYLSSTEIHNAYHSVLDANHPINKIVNLHLTDMISWTGKDTQYLLKDAFAFLELQDVTVDNTSNVLPGIGYPSISISNNEGAILKDVHILGLNAGGYEFKNSDAIWISRCSADTTAGIGFNFEDTDYVYISDSVASLNTHGGASFIGSDFVQLSNFVAAGRNGIPGALAAAHGVNFVGSTNIQSSNLSARNNTGIEVIVNGSNLVRISNFLAPNNLLGNVLEVGSTDVIISGI